MANWIFLTGYWWDQREVLRSVMKSYQSTQKDCGPDSKSREWKEDEWKVQQWWQWVELDRSFKNQVRGRSLKTVVWKQSQCSEKRHLPKGAVTLELKCPESETEWDYHRRGQKTIRDTNLAVYSRKFSFRVNYSLHQLAGWFLVFFLFLFWSQFHCHKPKVTRW